MQFPARQFGLFRQSTNLPAFAPIVHYKYYNRENMNGNPPNFIISHTTDRLTTCKVTWANVDPDYITEIFQRILSVFSNCSSLTTIALLYGLFKESYN